MGVSNNFRFHLLFLPLILVFTTSQSAHSEVVNKDADGLESTIYALDSNQQTPLFKGKYSILLEGDRETQINTIRDMNGNIVTVETLVAEKGIFSKYGYQRVNANEGGELILKGNILHYTYIKDETTKTEELIYPQSFVVGPALTAYARTKWDTIMKGDELPIRYGVLDRLDIFRFMLVKEGMEKRGSEDVVVVKLMPATWLVSKLVNPVYITFSKDGSKVYKVKGRTFLLVKKDGKWEPLDAETIYHHP